MTTTYTERFRLNKPDFRVSPWSALVNTNTDRLDEIIYNVLQANSIVTYENDLDVEAGTTVYDADAGSLWISRVSQTTEASGTFEEDRTANPDNWGSLTLGLTVRGQYAIDTHYAVNDLVYDASEGLTGYCNTEHTSPHTGSMRDEIDKWDIIFDSDNGGSSIATSVGYDDTNASYTAANVQVAIDELNALIDDAISDIAAHTTAINANTADIAELDTDLATAESTLASHATTIAGLGTASTHAHGDYATAAQGTLATNAMPKAGGTFTGDVIIANADLKTYRSGGTTGVIFLNSAGGRYLYFDGTNYNMPGSAVVAGNGRLWGASDFSSVGATSFRWVSGGALAMVNTEGNPYVLSGGVYGNGTAAGPTAYYTRYLQYFISGSWVTAGFV